MKIGFDLDGTLDRKPVRDLAQALLSAGHEVYIISGCFLEAGEWQDEQAKLEKLVRFGLAISDDGPGKFKLADKLHVKVLVAVDHTLFDRDYRLADLGLRKGAYIAEQEIEIMFDDSEIYCKLMPAMCGAQIVHVR